MIGPHRFTAGKIVTPDYYTGSIPPRLNFEGSHFYFGGPENQRLVAWQDGRPPAKGIV
jgi:hypothetical protein